MDDRIQIDLAVSPLDPEHPSREQLLRRIESLLPGLHLVWHAKQLNKGPVAKRVQMVRLPSREVFVQERLRGDDNALLFSGRNEPAVSVGFIPGHQVARDGSRSAQVTINLLGEPARGALLWQLFAASCETAQALLGSCMPSSSGGELMVIQVAREIPAQSSILSLLQADPALQSLPRFPPGMLPTAAAPPAISWLNYWSAETGRFLGLEQGAEVPFARVERTASGAWAWKLTEEPFDTHRRDHTAALAEAYRRFPKVGVRLPP